jgi:hypothetical protein
VCAFSIVEPVENDVYTNCRLSAVQKNMHAENMRILYGQCQRLVEWKKPRVRTIPKNAIKLHPALGPEKTGIEVAAKMRLVT